MTSISPIGGSANVAATAENLDVWGLVFPEVTGADVRLDVFRYPVRRQSRPRKEKQ